MEKIEKNKGITLIALAITIIVLLILAGVTIETLTRDNGIITKATESKNKTDIESEKEVLNMSYSGCMIGKNGEKITAKELEKEIKNYGYDAYVSGSTNLTVTFDKTGNAYNITKNGKIIQIESVKQIADDNPGEFNGDGSESNPYLIESVEDIVSLSTKINSGENYDDKWFKLKQSLDFCSDRSYVNPNTRYVYNEEMKGYVVDENGTEIKKLCTEGKGFKAIGDDGVYFKGNIDGNNCSIINLYINREDESYCALMAFMKNSKEGKQVVIKNLNIINVNIFAQEYVSGFVAYGEGIDIINCKASGTLTSSEWAGGGVLCDGGKSNIKKCINYCDIESKCYVGGIVGQYYTFNSDAEKEEDVKYTIEECYNYGNITETGEWCAGGIAGGINRKAVVVNRCANYGKINGINGGEDGGIAGYSLGYIKNCYNAGSVNGGEYIGGIAGMISGGSIKNCYNVGEINGKSYVAGISSKNKKNSFEKIIENCFCLNSSANVLYIDENDIEYTDGIITEGYMKTDEFINQLNNGNSNGVWKKDTENKNNGYPWF